MARKYDIQYGIPVQIRHRQIPSIGKLGQSLLIQRSRACPQSGVVELRPAAEVIARLSLTEKFCNLHIFRWHSPHHLPTDGPADLRTTSIYLAQTGGDASELHGRLDQEELRVSLGGALSPLHWPRLHADRHTDR